MTGVIAGLAISAVCIAYLLLITELVKPHNDDRHQADETDRAGSGDRALTAALPAPHGQAPARYGVTWPAPATAALPWQPRISAGRVTACNLIRFAYALADQPVSEYLASVGWPAQEEYA